MVCISSLKTQVRGLGVFDSRWSSGLQPLCVFIPQLPAGCKEAQCASEPSSTSHTELHYAGLSSVMDAHNVTASMWTSWTQIAIHAGH